MRTLLVTLLALFLIVPVADHAEAGKRFGGGSKLGQTFATKKKVEPTPSVSQKQTNSGATAQGATAAKNAAQPAKKRSGFGGLMAGLLGAGLLGALFFGGAFDGIEFMDILLIGLLAFIGWKLFSSMRRKQAPPQQAYAGAGAPYQPQPEPQPEPQPVPVQPEPVAARQSFEPVANSGGSFVEAELELPQWFQKEAFLEGARSHFSVLQGAWDRQDWAEIASYTSPELLEALKEERSKLEAQQHTEVVSVMAELVNFIDNGDHVIASLNFYGWLREDAEETTEFNEVWHLRRDMSSDGADWMIVGIEQP